MDDWGIAPRLNREELAARAELHGQRNEKMDEIVAMVARDLGYASLSSLTPDQRDAVEEEAEDAEERWSKQAEARNSAMEPRTPLQRLLREYHELGEKIFALSEAVVRRQRAG